MAENKIKSVVWSNKAIAQLNKIFEFLSKKSKFGLMRVSEEIIEKTNGLSKSYNFYPIDSLKNKNDGSHRVCFVFHYRISYRVEDKFVKITTVRHTSRIPLEH